MNKIWIKSENKREAIANSKKGVRKKIPAF